MDDYHNHVIIIQKIPCGDYIRLGFASADIFGNVFGVIEFLAKFFKIRPKRNYKNNSTVVFKNISVHTIFVSENTSIFVFPILFIIFLRENPEEGVTVTEVLRNFANGAQPSCLLAKEISSKSKLMGHVV